MSEQANQQKSELLNQSLGSALLCSVLSCSVLSLRFGFLFARPQEDEEEDALGLQLGLADLDSGSGLSPVLLAQQQAMLVSDNLTA